MKIHVTGKQMDVGDSFRTYIETEFQAVIVKYFDDSLEGHVVISKGAHHITADISIHMGRNVDVHCKGEATEPYVAFDQALSRLNSRLMRYKTRLKDHHKKHHGTNSDRVEIQKFILNPPSDVQEAPTQDGYPAIIAEMTLDILTLTVSDAVMHMDLTDSPVVMFKNSSNNNFNVVYRRQDGNIGWIDPTMQLQK